MAYLIKWRGYPESDATWEPVSNLFCKELLEEFREEEKMRLEEKEVQEEKPKKKPEEEGVKEGAPSNKPNDGDKKVKRGSILAYFPVKSGK